MSENADVPAVDLDRMTVPQLTTLIAAAEAKREDKLERQSGAAGGIGAKGGRAGHRPVRAISTDRAASAGRKRGTTRTQAA
jgi:hypothetical protein